MTDATRAERPPNILLVTVDQWPAHQFGHAGDETIETPTFDRLAAVGRTFPNAYAECPICIPARRSFMTGTPPRTHGDRDFQPALPMPETLATLPRVMRDAGWQTVAVGKLHVYPPRDRIGFEETYLAEEGRAHLGGPDDYELHLSDSGVPGEQFLHGMSNNEYGWRPWHLPEALHVTNWITRTTARAIKRRDPTRPSFWHVSYTHPHPPIVPLQAYLDRYRGRPVAPAAEGDWSRDRTAWPPALRLAGEYWDAMPPERLAEVKRAVYALCTHIDHQFRIILGTLREEGLLDDTVILFCGDHGDMLGDHGLYAKRVMYDASARVPMILVGRANCPRVTPGSVDERLVGLRDVMATVLDLAGIAPPETSEGLSMVGGDTRETLYAEALSGQKATRMIRDRRFKLVWYPAGNLVQLFDMASDPRECRDLASDPAFADDRRRLEAALAAELYGGDEAMATDGRLVGCPAAPFAMKPNRDLSGQRGLHDVPPPRSDPRKAVGSG